MNYIIDGQGDLLCSADIRSVALMIRSDDKERPYTVEVKYVDGSRYYADFDALEEASNYRDDFIKKLMQELSEQA